MTLNPDAPVFGLAALGQLEIASAQIGVAATGVTGLRSGPAPGKPLPATPFAPFGPAPAPGAALDITHPDLAMKRLTALTLEWDWHRLPAAPADLASHYAPYDLGTKNSDFRGRFALWQSENWSDLIPVDRPEAAKADGVALFTTVESEALQCSARWQFAPLDIAPQPDALPPRLRLTFTAPGYGFANAVYPDILGAAVLRKARQQRSLWAKLTGEKPAPLPPPPVKPQIAGLSLSYTAEARLDRGEVTILAQNPFGALTMAEHPVLVPMPMTRKNMLFSGFSGLAPGETVDLFIELAETSEAQQHPVTASPKARLHWACRDARGWRALPPDALGRDGTRALTTTGIVTIKLPVDLAADSSGLAWLALTAPPGTQALCQFRQIAPDAVQVRRQIAVGTAPETATAQAPAIPAKAITRLENRMPTFGSVSQPLPSDGGEAVQDTRAFYTWLSERLANRDRAIPPAITRR